VSVEAISWALNLAPVPADRGGQPSSACKFVLVGLANHAGPDGTGAFPSVATLLRYTGLSERTVRTCLDRLEAAGIIAPCDPDIVAARIKRADRRPQGWDLNLGLVRDDLTNAGIVMLERQFRRSAPRLATVAQHGPDLQTGGVQSPHPAPDNGEPVDNLPDEVQQLHPAPGTGCNQRSDGVQGTQPRGAVVAPEPPRESSMEPSAAPERAREAPLTGHAGPGGGDQASEFFAALADAWLLTAGQRARLVPAVEAALNTGWTPDELAEFTGGNTGGVRNPYAVLAARLSPAELPQRRDSAPRRPPRCGECDERTRMLGFDGDAPRPCPRCKPTHRASESPKEAATQGKGRPLRANGPGALRALPTYARSESPGQIEPD
jgi:Helix-turn-helix domain